MDLSRGSSISKLLRNMEVTANRNMLSSASEQGSRGAWPAGTAIFCFLTLALFDFFGYLHVFFFFFELKKIIIKT